MITVQDMERLLFTGGDVVGEDGRKIGSIGQLFLDATTGEPAWLTVTTGLFGTSESFVPLAGAGVRGDEIVVPYGKDLVKHAPRIDSRDGSLSPAEERDLYRHYGLVHDDTDDVHDDVRDDVPVAVHDDVPVAEPAAVTDPVPQVPPPAPVAPLGRPVDDDPARADGDALADGGRGASAARPADDGMVLSAEQLRVVGTERVPTERVRLRRYTVTEQREITVPVQREEFRVEYEPAEDGVLADRDERPGPDVAGEPGTAEIASASGTHAEDDRRHHGRHVADSGTP